VIKVSLSTLLGSPRYSCQ